MDGLHDGSVFKGFMLLSGLVLPYEQIDVLQPFSYGGVELIFDSALGPRYRRDLTSQGTFWLSAPTCSRISAGTVEFIPSPGVSKNFLKGDRFQR